MPRTRSSPASRVHVPGTFTDRGCPRSQMGLMANFQGFRIEAPEGWPLLQRRPPVLDIRCEPGCRRSRGEYHRLMKVGCKSVWLLHFAAALRPSGLGNLTTQQRTCGTYSRLAGSVSPSTRALADSAASPPLLRCTYKVSIEMIVSIISRTYTRNDQNSTEG